MNRANVVILLGALLATSAAAQATTYVRVEPDGTKTYSDRPLPGGHPVDVQPAQTYSAPPTSSTSSRRPGEEQSLMNAANFRYEGCALLPRNDETYSNPESVSVSLQLTPSLRYGDQVNFTLDGAPVAGGGAGQTNFAITQPDRGSHTVTVHITEADSGRTLCETTTTFHVMRPTVNSPTRRPPSPPPKPTPH
jgi:hypothetical protein